ncbi:MAG: lysozyme [Calditrichaeota bacterium]|nr:MAG: lysozyme [Calditrichota bacterium]
MSRPLLRLFDGYEHTTPELKDAVKELQRLLVKHGYSLNPDGEFGRGTEAAVKDFQRRQGLDDDGIVGPTTWAALLGEPLPEPEPGGVPAMERFRFSTTYSRNDPTLLKQLQEAEKYRQYIEEASAKYNFQDSVIAGVGSRESHWGLALKPPGPGGTGDFFRRSVPGPGGHRTTPLPPDGGGFGRGLMQIDYDYHEFARTGNWKDPRANIDYGCKVLYQSRAHIARKTNLRGLDLLRATLAAYNCGVGNVLRAIREGRDVDFFTSGRDYSRDVLNRAGWFQLHGWE